jgi:hypothetical protein
MRRRDGRFVFDGVIAKDACQHGEHLSVGKFLKIVEKITDQVSSQRVVAPSNTAG